MRAFSAMGSLLIWVRAGAAAALIGLLAIVALPGTSANAGDLLDVAPPSVPGAAPSLLVSTPSVPAPNWSGPYIGLGFGFRYSAVDANVTSATVGTPPTAISIPSVSATPSSPFAFWDALPAADAYVDNIALRGNIYAGWNYQLTPVYVVGVELDFAWAREKAAVHGSPYPANLLFGSPSSFPLGASPNDSFQVETIWDGAAQLRFGQLVTPSILVYLSAGAAWAHIDVKSSCSTSPTANVSNCAPGNYFSGTLGPATIEQPATMLGWTAGAGVDVAITSHWVARVQYRFSDFGYPNEAASFGFTSVRVCTGCSAGTSPLRVSYDVVLMQHIFGVGIAYAFGP
jgi:outer membrane immunogenic protein